MADRNVLLNQSAGHNADIRQWEESEAGKAFVKDANKREQAEKEAAEAQEAVPVENFDTTNFHEHDANDDGVAVQGQDLSDDGSANLTTEATNEDGDAAPSKSAHKDVWVDYAVSKGADRDEAESGTKDDLIDKYGD